jgi:hypothetical protein
LSFLLSVQGFLRREKKKGIPIAIAEILLMVHVHVHGACILSTDAAGYYNTHTKNSTDMDIGELGR